MERVSERKHLLALVAPGFGVLSGAQQSLTYRAKGGVEKEGERDLSGD